jgi:Flp pilus assembly protein CpaB
VGRARLGSGRERALRLFAGRHRRPLTLLMVLLAVWFTARAATPEHPPLTSVLVAGRDLPAGRTVTAGDLRTAHLPADAVPAGRFARLPAPAVLGSPLREGEPLTDARLLGPGLLTGARPGRVAMPVRLSDPAGAAVVRTGDRVDVLAAAASGSSDGPAQHLVLGAQVLAVPPVSEEEHGVFTGGAAPTGDTGVVILAVTSAEAERLTAAQPQSYLSVAVLPPA